MDLSNNEINEVIELGNSLGNLSLLTYLDLNL